MDSSSIISLNCVAQIPKIMVERWPKIFKFTLQSAVWQGDPSTKQWADRLFAPGQSTVHRAGRSAICLTCRPPTSLGSTTERQLNPLFGRFRPLSFGGFWHKFGASIKIPNYTICNPKYLTLITTENDLRIYLSKE